MFSDLCDDYVDFGNQKSDRRYKSISKITIHHMAGNCNPRYCAEWHRDGNKDVSSNYYIGSDGSIVGGVSEDRRAWSTGDEDNDQSAINIEVANCSRGPEWRISDEALVSLLALCIDICKRYNFRLNWTGDKYGSLTTHNMLVPTICPGPYLMKMMKDIALNINKFLEEYK